MSEHTEGRLVEATIVTELIVAAESVAKRGAPDGIWPEMGRLRAAIAKAKAALTPRPQEGG